jgi:hypothetical protein
MIEDKFIYVSDFKLIKVMPSIKYDQFLNKDIQNTSLLMLFGGSRSIPSEHDQNGESMFSSISLPSRLPPWYQTTSRPSIYLLIDKFMCFQPLLDSL